MRAGPIDVDYADGELWAIRWNGHEIVRRIYPVLQDANWHVRPWIIEDEHVDADDEAFRIRVRGRGNHLAPEFTWTAEITGDASGRIAYEWAGSTSAPFWRNRLGLCVLLPIEGLAGKAGVVISPDGTRRDVTFPAAISPHQPFGDAVGIEFDAGAAVRIDFTGDVFEAEDHRNWGDASYKVYCTPIDLPRPVEVCPGDEVRQSVTLTWPVAPARTPDVAGADLIEVARDAVPLPRLGVMAAPEPWTPAEAEEIGRAHV